MVSRVCAIAGAPNALDVGRITCQPVEFDYRSKAGLIITPVMFICGSQTKINDLKRSYAGVENILNSAGEVVTPTIKI